MKETGRSARSRPREPSAPGPRGAEGSQGHVNSRTPYSSLQRHKSSERRPHYRALPRYEPDINARRSGRRHKDERPHAHSVNQRTGQRASQGQPRCHPALSLARWA